MSNALKNVTLWIAGTALALTLAACSADTSEENPDPATPAATTVSESPEVVEPGDPTAPTDPDEDAEGEGQQSFDGEGMLVETITANNMEIEVPKGIRIPENALVTEATKSSIMMADEDPSDIVDMVTASAKEAGYEEYAEAEGSRVLVGNGNAILFVYGPQVQMLTWGPEAMKDILADG